VLEGFIARIVTDSRSDEDDLELIWKSLTKLAKHVNRQPNFQVTEAFQSLFLILSRYNEQEWILNRFRALIQSSDEGQLFVYASKFKLKVSNIYKKFKTLIALDLSGRRA
jgi:hypothetical protein